MGRDQLRRLAGCLLLLALAACAPAPDEGNPVQTAIAATLTARPLVSPTLPAVTATADPHAPPQGQIVYVCQYTKRSGRNQICIMNADGGDQRVLTTAGAYDDFFPSITPDGEWVLFASTRSGRYQIYELNIQTGALHQLTIFNEYSAFAPTASPDGTHIVFYANRDGEEYPESHNIWIMARDGSNPVQITNLPGGGWDPVWSPDGTRIQFASEINGVPQLFHMNADGSQLEQVTDISGIRGRNDWSSDGTKLSTYVGFSWDRDIYVFDPEGENIVQLTDGGNNLAPSFSPDAQWITFMSYRDHPQEDLGCEIYIMRVDGSEPTRLTDNGICDWQPRWGN
jgi:TolB protein